MIKLLVLAIVLFPASVLRSEIVELDFESLTDSEAVTNQLAGFNFSNTTALTSGISLNEFDFPPASGSNVVFDNGGPITIVFDSLVSSFQGLFTYAEMLTVNAFDDSNNVVDSISSLFGSNLGLSGDLGSSPNEALDVAFAAGIRSVTIAGNAGGGSFALDNVQVDTIAVSVPEPRFTSIIEPVVFTLFSALFLMYMRRRAQKEAANP